jgi:hypothetical protein
MAKTPAAAAKKPAKPGNNLIARFLLRSKIPSNNVRGAQLAERDKALGTSEKLSYSPWRR